MFDELVWLFNRHMGSRVIPEVKKNRVDMIVVFPDTD